MNKPIRRVSVIALVLFLSLFASSTWISFVQAPELNADSRNVRSLYREFGTNRGAIIVAGEEIASTEPIDDAFKYQRTYPKANSTHLSPGSTPWCTGEPASN